MCGRFVLLTDLSVLKQEFHIADVVGDHPCSRDFFPGQEIAAVVRGEVGRRLVNFTWGLVPAWAKDPSLGKKIFNARAESLREKPSFREAFRKRRCLIVADGFFEWQVEGKTKKPICFFLKSGKPFGLAGLYEHWSGGGKTIDSCTVITTEPNDLIRSVHQRMPVIIPKSGEDLWLDHGVQDPKMLLPLLQAYPAEEMESSAAVIPYLPKE